RQRFVAAFNIASIVNDARRAGVNELAHAVFLTSRDDVFGAGDVRGDEFPEPPPDAGLRRHVDDGVAATDGIFNCCFVDEIAVDLSSADFLKPGIGAAREGDDTVAARLQAADDSPAEKPAAAGDED